MKRFKDFSIKTKFAILFVIDGFFIALAALSIVYFVSIRGLTDIENFYLEHELRTVQTVINKDIDRLLSNVKDYAYWDDMYNYASKQDGDWVKLNITDWIPKNFGIDLILIFDGEGKLIYQYGDFDEFQINKDLSNHPLLKKAFEFRETKGLYPTSKGIACMAASQIMHTDESGPRNGTYLYGKLISKAKLNELKSFTETDPSIISENKVINTTVVGYIDRPRDFKDIYYDLASDKFQEFKIYKSSHKSAFLYSILKDIENKDIGIIELIRPRKSVVFMSDLLTKMSIWIFISVILTVIITVLIITKSILKPLDILKKHIEDVEKTGDLLKRVTVESQDEVGILARDFNAMSDRLSKSQDTLMEVQQNLIKSEKMATAAELAMGAVHQINNPLSIVIGRVQMLLRLIGYKTLISQPDLEKDLKVIEENIKRAIDITNDLLHYASPTTLRFEKCDINEVVEDAIDLIKPSLEAENINVIENLKEDLPFMQYCDRQQMKDVFINIIINAQQAMADAGTLEISTDYNEKEDMVHISFIDNGCGITPDDIKKLFTPFFSTKADKSGLGLAISYNIVKGHLGTIEVESNVGAGSTFTVKLPTGRRLK